MEHRRHPGAVKKDSRICGIGISAPAKRKKGNQPSSVLSWESPFSASGKRGEQPSERDGEREGRGEEGGSSYL